MKRISRMLLVGLVIIGCGCAGPKNWKAQPDFTKIYPAGAPIGVIVQGVTVKEIAVGGDAVVDEERSKEARESLGQGAVEAFTKQGNPAKLITTKDTDVAKMLAAYSPIRREIGSHFPDAHTPPVNRRTISGLDTVLQKNDVSCVAIINALDHVSSAGRKAAMAAVALFVQMGHGIAYGDLVIACQDGRPLYFSSAQGDQYKLASVGDAKDMTDVMLRGIKVEREK